MSRLRNEHPGPVTIPKALQHLVGEIMDQYPHAEINVDPLPSGVCWLSIWFGRRNFELEYSPTRGTGVSENFKDTPPFIGHDKAFDSLDEAVAHFKKLLTDAAHTEADHLPKEYALHESPIPWNKKQ
jgi:hypothetical protein